MIIQINKNYWHLKSNRIYRVTRRVLDCDNTSGSALGVQVNYRIVYRNREGTEFDRSEREFYEKFLIIPDENEFQCEELFVAIKVVEGNPSTVTGMKCDATFEQGKESIKGVAARDVEGNVTVTIDEQFDKNGACKIILHDGSESSYHGQLKDGNWSA